MAETIVTPERVNSPGSNLQVFPTVMLPTLTNRPPTRVSRTPSEKADGTPVTSMTMSGLAPPAAAMTASARSASPARPPMSTSSWAPKARAISRREGSTSVTTTRAPRSRAAAMPHSPSPPAPWNSTVSPSAAPDTCTE